MHNRAQGLNEDIFSLRVLRASSVAGVVSHTTRQEQRLFFCSVKGHGAFFLHTYLSKTLPAQHTTAAHFDSNTKQCRSGERSKESTTSIDAFILSPALSLYSMDLTKASRDTYHTGTRLRWYSIPAVSSTFFLKKQGRTLQP